MGFFIASTGKDTWQFEGNADAPNAVSAHAWSRGGQSFRQVVAHHEQCDIFEELFRKVEEDGDDLGVGAGGFKGFPGGNQFKGATPCFGRRICRKRTGQGGR